MNKTKVAKQRLAPSAAGFMNIIGGLNSNLIIGFQIISLFEYSKCIKIIQMIDIVNQTEYNKREERY